MKKIIAKIDFTANDVPYIKGDEINNLDYNQITKLNEKGFIEPLDYKDLVLIKRELESPKKDLKYKKEEEL